MPVIRDTMCGGGGTISYATWFPDKTRFLVILAHGYAEHGGRYTDVAYRLAAEGAVVCAPDHLGHGRSDGTPGLVRDLESLVDDLGTLHKRLRGQYAGIPVVLLGHAMGGLIALRYAQRGVELDAMVLSGPIVGGDPSIAALLTRSDAQAGPSDLGSLSRDLAQERAYAGDGPAGDGPMHRQTLEALTQAAIRAVDSPALHDLPVLWIHGELDRLAPLAGTRTAMHRVGGLDLEELLSPRAEHELLDEINRDAVLDGVTDFLRRTLKLSRAAGDALRRGH